MFVKREIDECRWLWEQLHLVWNTISIVFIPALRSRFSKLSFFPFSLQKKLWSQVICFVLEAAQIIKSILSTKHLMFLLKPACQKLNSFLKKLYEPIDWFSYKGIIRQ